jgi:hypothetical protein
VVWPTRWLADRLARRSTERPKITNLSDAAHRTRRDQIRQSEINLDHDRLENDVGQSPQTADSPVRVMVGGRCNRVPVPDPIGVIKDVGGPGSVPRRSPSHTGSLLPGIDAARRVLRTHLGVRDGKPHAGLRCLTFHSRKKKNQEAKSRAKKS